MSRIVFRGTAYFIIQMKHCLWWLWYPSSEFIYSVNINQPAATETFSNAISIVSKSVYENIDTNHINEDLANEMHKIYNYILSKEHGRMMTLNASASDKTKYWNLKIPLCLI